MTCHCNHEHQCRVELFFIDSKPAYRAYCACCETLVGTLATSPEDARRDAERHRGEKRREMVG